MNIRSLFYRPVCLTFSWQFIVTFVSKHYHVSAFATCQANAHYILDIYKLNNMLTTEDILNFDNANLESSNTNNIGMYT